MMPHITALEGVTAVAVTGVAIITAAVFAAVMRAENRRDDRREPHQPMHRRSRHDPWAGGGPAVSTGWQRPPPPPEFLAAPPPQASLAPAFPAPPAAGPGTAAAGDPLPLGPPPPLPELHHDRFRWPQRWHREPAERVPLPPVTGTAILALEIIIVAPARAHLGAIEQAAQAKASALAAEVRETRPWADDTGTFTFDCADVMAVKQ